MKRSMIDPLPDYFDRYINKCNDVDLIAAIEASAAELDKADLEKWNQLGDRTYAPGKWTVKDILQHLLDAERIFMYRALAFARGEKASLPSFSEDDYAQVANANARSLDSLLEELKYSRRSFKAMFESFDENTLKKEGMGFKGTYSVASIGFIVPGHQRWHFEILETRYYPLLR